MSFIDCSWRQSLFAFSHRSGLFSEGWRCRYSSIFASILNHQVIVNTFRSVKCISGARLSWLSHIVLSCGFGRCKRLFNLDWLTSYFRHIICLFWDTLKLSLGNRRSCLVNLWTPTLFLKQCHESMGALLQKAWVLCGRRLQIAFFWCLN